MIDHVSFIESLPGLSATTDFALTPLDDNGLLFTLRGEQGDPTRLFVVQPGPYFADYTPSVPSSVRHALDLGEDDTRSAVLVIVTPSAQDTPPTANLLAPLVLNTETGRAVQVILEGTPWPVRAPLVAA